jgi:hypothetical protein
MAWNTNEPYLPRTNLLEATTGQSELATNDDCTSKSCAEFRGLLYHVLGRFPDAFTAVKRSLEERVEEDRARQKETGRH